MLRYFRINDPYRLLALFILLVVLCLPLFIDRADVTQTELKSFVVGEKVTEGHVLYTEIIDRTPPLASWFYGLCDWIFGRNLTGRHVTAFFVLFFQSAFLSIILIDKRAFQENTFIPSLIFSVLTLFSFDFLSLTADLAASGFLLLAFNAMLTEIEFRVQRDETILNMGLFIGLASLFNFSFVIFLPGACIILVLFTRNSIRKYLLLLVGFLLPHALLICIYYVYGNAVDLVTRFYIPHFSLVNESLIGLQSLLVLGSVPMVYLFISLFVFNRQAHLTKYQAQLSQATFLWLLIALVQMYFTTEFRPQSLLPLVPPAGFFITHFLLLIRRRKFAEMNTWILILGTTITLYLSRYQKELPVDYSNLFVANPASDISGKKILVLDHNPGLFLQNTLSPPFIDWPLSKKIFEGPDLYENVILVNALFEKDPPELIIDPENKMEKFFERLPQLKSKYRKSEHGWISN